MFRLKLIGQNKHTSESCSGKVYGPELKGIMLLEREIKEPCWTFTSTPYILNAPNPYPVKLIKLNFQPHATTIHNLKWLKITRNYVI